MASILVLSENGRELPIANKLKSEGHIVKVWIKNGNGEILKDSRNPSRIQNPTRLMEQYDLILASGRVPEQAQLAWDAGKMVLGCNSVMGKLMTDIGYQQKVLDFILGKQELIEGIEIRLTGWVSESGFTPLFLLSLPSLYFMEGDKGVKTGGMGSLVVTLPQDSNLTKLLLPFGEYLQKARYLGPFTASFKIKNTLWNILEVTSCFIPEDIIAMAEILKCSLFEFLFGLLEGRKGEAWESFGLSVNLTAPPWPYMGPPIKVGYIEVPEPAKNHFSPADLWLGVLGVASARGWDVREARRRVYRTVSNSVVDRTCQYREDIGLTQEKDLQALREWGWVI